ncbi:MAG TPA: chemotaxis protein CheW [Bryobacteraceae bacterium]|jgi:purine-binding chemotaxis protein CheW
MPIPQKPSTRSTDSNDSQPGILPDLLAGLLQKTAAVPGETPALTPEVLSPEEMMPPATPVNAAMPEFLASLRTLLEAHDGLPDLTGELPSDAVQDFAHGTHELLNYLLHEVVGTVESQEEEPAVHSPEAAQDFEYGTNELLNYLLSQVMNPRDPEEDQIEFSPEAMADFQAGTQDLLNQLLAMTELEEEKPAAPADPAAASESAEFEAFQQDLLDGLMGVAPEPPPSDEDAPAPIEVIPERDLARGLLDGLLANLTESEVAEAAVPDPPRSHGLGEVPLEYVDESDREDVERPAGPFEMLLDQIDAELPPPPQIRGIAQSTEPKDAGERFVSFELAGKPFALPFECVVSTDHIPRSTFVPGMPAHLRGVLNLRGEIIPLVDLRMLMGIDAAQAGERMVVIRDLATGKTPLALVVDRLLGLTSISAGDIVKSEGETGFASGSATPPFATSPTTLLDPGRVLAAAAGEAQPITIEFQKTDKKERICLER